MNSITVAGSLGRDAELRHMNNGDPVLNFSVADSQGKDKPTIWWNCQLFGKRADSLEPYLKKGQSVTVAGSIQEREYEKDGQTRKALNIRVSEIALMGKRETEQKPKKQEDDFDNDIPF